jgi:CRP-like cAMP-binding protein
MQVIINYFQQYLPFSPEEQELITSKFTLRNIKRKQMILQEGFICKHYFFVVEGCFKMYAIDEKGNEHNLQFAAENDWIADIGSFHSEKPSKLFIEALEASVILQVEQHDLYFLYTNIPKLNIIFKVITEHKFIELQNRVLQNISSTGQQRYLNFLEQYPKLASRLPNTQIASYLGITPEFLSKIRKELSTNA